VSDVEPTDEQDVAESLDQDETGGGDADYPEDYPLDRPLGVEEYGTTGDEEETGESIRRRVAREEPDFGQPNRVRDDPDGIGDGHGLIESDDPEPGVFEADIGDEFGEEPAEEAAIHVIEDPS
jgi:hypothetical protein